MIQYFFTDDHRIVPPASDTPVVKKEIITAPYPLPTNISSQRQSIKSESKINLSMSAKEILESCKGKTTTSRQMSNSAVRKCLS